jgi:hypothetical protein
MDALASFRSYNPSSEENFERVADSLMPWRTAHRYQMMTQDLLRFCNSQRPEIEVNLHILTARRQYLKQSAVALTDPNNIIDRHVGNTRRGLNVSRNQDCNWCHQKCHITQVSKLLSTLESDKKVGSFPDSAEARRVRPCMIIMALSFCHANIFAGSHLLNKSAAYV